MIEVQFNGRLMDRNVITVVSGPFEPSQSSFACAPVALGPKLKSTCVITAKDQFGNPVDTIAAGTGGAEKFSLKFEFGTHPDTGEKLDNGGTDRLFLRVMPPLQTEKNGFYTVTYTTPIIPQTISIRIRNIGETSSVFLASNGDVTTVGVEVRTVQLDDEATTVECPEMMLSTGAPVDCIASLFSNGQPLSEPSMAAVLKAKVDIGGLTPEISIVHQLENQFVVRFVPFSIGCLRLAYR